MAKKAVKRSPTASKVRHPFLYRMESGSGKYTVHKAWAVVKYATKEVPLVLNETHVLRSMQRNGVGNTSKCSMALCTYAHAKLFPHSVEGHVDWQYSRAFVVSKLNKLGLPCECYVYEHDDRGVAKLNDTLGGQQKLLDRIQKSGPITVVLKPFRPRSETGRPGRSRKSTGKRDPIKTIKGARLRYATSQLGAVPA